MAFLGGYRNGRQFFQPVLLQRVPPVFSSWDLKFPAQIATSFPAKTNTWRRRRRTYLWRMMWVWNKKKWHDLGSLELAAQRCEFSHPVGNLHTFAMSVSQLARERKMMPPREVLQAVVDGKSWRLAWESHGCCILKIWTGWSKPQESHNPRSASHCVFFVASCPGRSVSIWGVSMVRTPQLLPLHQLCGKPPRFLAPCTSCDFKELTPEELAQVAHKRLETKLDVGSLTRQRWRVGCEGSQSFTLQHDVCLHAYILDTLRIIGHLKYFSCESNAM